ncbi:MAG: response regulator [Anaerolineaceae bacterium]|nr:response regulator [Anaerolineaceae bacterium]
MAETGLNGRTIDILLVEDNPGDARRIELMLDTADVDYRLHTAVSLKSTFNQLTALPAEVVLLDLTLPDSSGVETVRSLRSAYPWTPIVVLTGLEDEQLITEAATAGAHDYLVKQDLTPANLRRVLRYALERRSHEEQIRTSQSAYRRQARELNLLNRIISAASASNSKQEILHDTCLELAHFYGTLRTLILLYQHQDTLLTVEAESHQAHLQPLRGRQLNIESGAAFMAVTGLEQSLILPSLPLRLKQFLATPANSKLIVQPLYISGEQIGFFVLNLAEDHELSAGDARLLGMVAEEISLTLEKIQLYGRLQAYTNELEERVQRRTQALAEANEQLKSLDRLKSKFVSDVSHELRNPITNLTLYLELLEFAPPGKQAKYFSTLRTQIRRLSSLVEEILTLSRLENNKYNHLYQPVDFNYLIQQVVNVHKLRAQSKQIKLSFTPATPLPPAWGEPNQLTQIVTNLLDNALNYTAQGSIQVTTSLCQDGDKAEIELRVSDTGMGIPQEDLPHIFERFYRGSQVNRDEMIGTGLGLGIVSEIVSLHNGRIDVSSTPNQGATFTVHLPTAPEQ